MEVSASGRTTWSDFSCALGRLGFGANALSWERPFLGPMYSLTVPVMIRVILRWLAERFQEGGRLQEPMTLTGTPGKVEITFFSDAKAENGKAYVGGYLWNGHEVLSWYAAEVLPSWAPWAFIKNDPQRTIASLELLGTLLCVKLWGSKMSGQSRSAGSITGATDNQGNTYAVTKLMSTKFPLPILLMELSETLRLGSVFLDLHWVPRERNQWADDLTNGEFKHFPMDKRQALDAHAIQWHVLGKLLEVAQAFHDEMVREKGAAKQRRGGGHVSSGTVRKAKRARTKW